MEVLNPTKEQLEKYDRLLEYLKSLGSVAVAYSSGVDSTFLLYAAKQALGEKAIAITASAASVPNREVSEANDYCKEMNIKQLILHVDQFAIDGFAQNPANRCYLCKRELFSEILRMAKAEGMNEVVEGSNLDDTGDYRPGMQAIAELEIKSPLRKAMMTKEDIRVLSKHFDIPTWNKPSYACLASRFVYGEAITKEKLEMVDKAEQMLLDYGFKQFRVRIHGNMARIEVLPEEFDKLLSNDIRTNVVSKFKEFGFSYVSMDLTGYRTGSMNEVI